MYSVKFYLSIFYYCIIYIDIYNICIFFAYLFLGKSQVIQIIISKYLSGVLICFPDHDNFQHSIMFRNRSFQSSRQTPLL